MHACERACRFVVLTQSIFEISARVAQRHCEKAHERRSIATDALTRLLCEDAYMTLVARVQPEVLHCFVMH